MARHETVKACLSPVSKPRHINSMFTVNTQILYIYSAVMMRYVFTTSCAHGRGLLPQVR